MILMRAEMAYKTNFGAEVTSTMVALVTIVVLAILNFLMELFSWAAGVLACSELHKNANISRQYKYRWCGFEF